ncbi:MAG: hypothetical protein WBE43_08415 [Candidatus Acidiferrales bacterium]
MFKVICVAAFLALSVQVSYAQQTEGSPNQVETSKIPAGEAHFTPEQLQQYYLVYKNADVQYLRTVFDAYLQGKGGREEEFQLLKKWDKSYYRNKFVVLSRNGNPFGGTIITIIFEDRPDKVFQAWVYPEGIKKILTLRVFDLGKFSSEDVRRIRVRYKQLLEDKVHAM